MQSLQRRLLKSLWMNQSDIIKAPGEAASAKQILQNGKLWADAASVPASDQQKAIDAAKAGQAFSKVSFKCD